MLRTYIRISYSYINLGKKKTIPQKKCGKRWKKVKNLAFKKQTIQCHVDEQEEYKGEKSYF